MMEYSVFVYECKGYVVHGAHVVRNLKLYIYVGDQGKYISAYYGFSVPVKLTLLEY